MTLYLQSILSLIGLLILLGCGYAGYRVGHKKGFKKGIEEGKDYLHCLKEYMRFRK